MTKSRREKTIIAPLAGVMAVITIIAIFAVVILRQTAAQQQKEEKVAQAMSEIQQEKETAQAAQAKVMTAEAPATTFSLPQQMKGAQIQPGREFLTELSDQVEAAQRMLSVGLESWENEPEVPAEIDQQKAVEEIEEMVQSAAEMGLDTLFVSLNNAYGTLGDSSCEMVSFDVMSSLYDAVHAAGMQLYGVYDLSFAAGDGQMEYISSVNAESLDQSAQQMAQMVSSVKLDGILLDGYLNPETEDSYAAFTRSGENRSMDAYMTQNTQILVENAVETVRKTNPGIPVGLAVNPVWATEEENADGIALNYTQTSLGEYHADTKSMVEQGICDFAVVKNYGSIASTSVPFQTVADWWNDVFEQCGITAYMGHASSKAGVWENGWGANNELANQWEIAEGESAFSGSVFNSLETLLKDPNYTTYYLKEAWASKDSMDSQESQTGSDEDAVVSEEETTQQTQDTWSAELENTAAETSEWDTTQSGTYSDRADQYAAGSVLVDIDPVGTRSVADGDTIEIVAIAARGADVTAMVNGQMIALDETAVDSGVSGCSKYVGEYLVSALRVSSDMGNITVTASKNGQTDTLTGAKLVFQESSSPSNNNSSSNQSSSNNSSDTGTLKYQKPKLSTSSSKKIGDGTLVQVVSEQALTFPVSKNTIYPDTKCYPMPYGTMDYVVGDKVSIKDGSSYRYYYKLKSGRRVYCDDVQAVSSGISIKNNQITDMTVKANTRFTYVILKSDYPVSYLPDYSTGRMKFDFQNTVSTPGNLQLSKNPLFSSATWDGSTLELEFLDDNGFLGYKGYHENGNIVLRFNNPTGIEGARITVDPGHGGSDPGVADNIDPNWPEKKINWELSKEIASALEAKGAQVKLLETYNTTTSLDSRLAQAKNFDSSLFLCIHTNSSETNKGAYGSECYYFYPFSKNLALKMSSATSKGLSTNDRGAKYDVFYVNRDPQFVSILSEVGFLTNSSDYDKMKKDSYQEKVGQAVADAVAAYLENAGAEYAGRVGVQSTGGALNASNGPSFTVDSSASSGSSSDWDDSEDMSTSSGSEEESSTGSSSSSSSRPSGPVSETVVSEGNTTGTVKYIIFTDPENKKLNMKAGEEKKLGIKISGDSSVQRKYTTSDKYVATIDKNGVVTAVGAGTCRITVVAGDQGGSIDVTVTGTSKNPPSSSSSSSNNTNSSSSSSSSSRPSGSGPVSETVVSEGNTTGTVKYIIFTDPEDKKLSMSVGEEKQLGIKISGDSSVQKKYTTSDKYVATVDKNGVVTAVGAGTCRITVVAGDQGGSIEVTVGGKSRSAFSSYSAEQEIAETSYSSQQDIHDENSGLESSTGTVPITSIKIRSSKNYVEVGKSIQLEAVFSPSNATKQDVTWSISRGSWYGSVDEWGVFTGIESGFSTVTATTADGAYSATYRIEII